MLTYSVDFLSKGVRREDNMKALSELGFSDEMSSPTNSSSPPALDRSTGSPDSLKSESSGDSPNSVTDVLLSLQKQAAIISGVSKTETEKPVHSYIALISMAILSSKGKRMLLGEIYEFIMNKFPYYDNETKAWRNSIRHNLSINECFIKNGRADNGKGNYWSIHPACVEDFAKGDFRRRQARRRARKGGKDTNKNQFAATDRRCNRGYVPMTSQFSYQPMTSSPIGYHPMTPSSVSNQMNCFEYPLMTPQPHVNPPYQDHFSQPPRAFFSGACPAPFRNSMSMVPASAETNFLPSYLE